MRPGAGPVRRRARPLCSLCSRQQPFSPSHCHIRIPNSGQADLDAGGKDKGGLGDREGAYVDSFAGQLGQAAHGGGGGDVAMGGEGEEVVNRGPAGKPRRTRMRHS